METNVYIDGFNLYYGAVKDTPYKWLDLHKLCTLIFPKNDIQRIRYFTALVKNTRNDPTKSQRQQTFIRALETLPNLTVHYGSFLSSKVRMPLVRPLPGRRTALCLRPGESCDIQEADSPGRSGREPASAHAHRRQGNDH